LTPHLYLGPDDPAPEGVEVIRIVRQYVSPAERDEVELRPAEPSGDLFGADTKKFWRAGRQIR